jgi:multidrug efflux pump subunit AcrB
MGFNLSALAVRERAITLFLIVGIILAGGYAFLKLGRAEDPTFTVKVLTVSAAWPGATAQEMRDLVAEPLEKRMQELRWYDRVETFTRPGLALMTVILRDDTPAQAVPGEFYSWMTRRATCRRARWVLSSTTNTPTSPSRSTPSKHRACRPGC